MKKICILVAIISLFMLQSNVVMAYDRANNVDLDQRVNGSYSTLSSVTYSCGNGMIKGVNANVIKTISNAYLVLQAVVPIILVIMGMITLVKAVISSKEDEIKKAQMGFIKKLITGAIVFFIFVIVKLIVSVAADAGDNTKIMDCVNCFINGAKSNDCHKM